MQPSDEILYHHNSIGAHNGCQLMIRGIRELVAPESVGIALPRAHVLHNIGSPVAAASLNDLEIRFEDLIDYRRSPLAHGGRNLLLQKEDEAFRELEKLQQLKDNNLKPLIIDVTLPVEGRDVFVKERIHLAERLKDLNLLTVTTFELERLDEGFTRGLPSKEQSERIAKTLEAELLFGIESGDSVAFPGAIYQQIHVTDGVLSEKEKILAQGLALAQTRTRAPLYLSFSCGESENSVLERAIRAWLGALLALGVESKKLVFCHSDRWCRGSFGGTAYTFLQELFGLGVSVLFDMVGLLTVSDVILINPCSTSTSGSDESQDSESLEPPSDGQLVEWIAHFVNDMPHCVSQILLSTNVSQRIMYRRYGGGGYTYLFEHFKPRLLRQGVTAAQWDEIVRGNVVRLLAWYVPPEAPPIPKNYLQCSICSNYFEPIEGEYFTKFTFIYCGTKCLRRHSRQKFAPLPAKQ
ncbi:Phosphotriesterase-related protein [Phytophthora citrophthora]|uniref:Phosphotriesterase-related protein n=1 Tax=Phytophthora citrophthora TaxID=4793 RepID=A0AAD9GMM2_9STRA|nr:Phosphotriesterase-related protein [Phytophthora citrophthora]